VLYRTGAQPEPSNLTDGRQAKVEDDYRIRVRRGSEEDAKPKRTTKAGRRAQLTDDEE